MGPSCGGGGGDADAKRTKLSSAGAGGEEDRLSALPDDILLLILRRLGLDLGACAVARTSVLSRRWRRVWALLPDLCFLYSPDPRRIGPALEAHGAARLRCLCVLTRGAGPDSVSAWLRAAARRLSGRLSLRNDGGKEEGRGVVDLPCLERATHVTLHLGFLGLAVPRAGVFAGLSELHLSAVRFHGPGLLGDAVSWPRCPCLQKLTVDDARGLDSLTIHSDSLREVKLTELRGLRQLSIVAPALKELKVSSSFYYNYNRSQPVASITAPQLTTLVWMDQYDSSSVRLGDIQHVRVLSPFFFLVYGGVSSTHNQSCLSLLRRFKVIESLNIKLAYLWNIDDRHYVMEDMTMLPDIRILHLNVLANGHAFGPSALHVLRMCSNIRRLTLTLHAPTVVEAQTTCPPGCICGEHENWKTEHLLLNRLQEVEITRLRGSEHEVTFVKQLFIWATSLERMTITLDHLVTGTVAMELCQVLRSFSRPEIRTKIQTFEEMVLASCM